MSLVVGGAIAAIGEALRVWTAGHVEKGREVTTSGPYRWTAHPLYLGSSIIGTGLVVATASWIVALLVASYLAISLTAAMRTEEAELTAKFGDEYREYRHGRAAGSDRAFSLARVKRNREERAVVGLVAGMGALALKMLLRI